jgi:hypothetical protein
MCGSIFALSSNNRIPDEGAKHLGKVLPKNQGIQILKAGV